MCAYHTVTCFKYLTVLGSLALAEKVALKTLDSMFSGVFTEMTKSVYIDSIYYILQIIYVKSIAFLSVRAVVQCMSLAGLELKDKGNNEGPVGSRLKDVMMPTDWPQSKVCYIRVSPAVLFMSNSTVFNWTFREICHKS